MTITFKKAQEASLKLSHYDKIKLISILEQELAPILSSTWEKEIQSRDTEYKKGNIKTVSLSSVLKKVKALS